MLDGSPPLQPDTPPMRSGCTRDRSPASSRKPPRRLADLDGRTRAAKWAKEALETAIGERGGRERMNIAQLKCAEAWAVLTAMIEGIGAGWFEGDEMAAADLGTLLNARRREREGMGEVQPRDVTPTLDAYINQRTKKD